MKKTLSIITAVFLITLLYLGSTYAQNPTSKGLFIGYETLEMSMNKFRNFAGEVGYRLSPSQQVRLMIGEVDLSERHLSSSWEAYAVDGTNVTGYFRIYELYYDRFFFKNKSWYASASMAYVRDEYRSTISDNRIDNETATIGFAIGYMKKNLFGINHLYINASMPFRYYFNSIPETQWGETTIREHKYVNNIWLFLGYSF